MSDGLADQILINNETGVRTVAGNETMNDSDKTQGWVLDKRVPVAIIFGLVIQAMGAIWWAATMEGRVVALEARWNQQATQSKH